MLAGIIQSPSRWDPAKNLEKSSERWNFVLDGMVAQGWLARGRAGAAGVPGRTWPEAPPSGGIPGDDRRPHLQPGHGRARRPAGITEEEINTEGLTITTTIDSKRQAQAVAGGEEGAEGAAGRTCARALVSVDPKTGAILAYYGGLERAGHRLRRRRCASRARRSSRSCWPPRCRTTPGVGLGTHLRRRRRRRTSSGGGRSATPRASSCDQCTVQDGDDQVDQHRLLQDGHRRRARSGWSTPRTRPGSRPTCCPSPRGGIALGDKEVHPIDMASAFATFAADGVRHEPYIVSKVDGRRRPGALRPRHRRPGEQAVPQQVARNVTEAMIDVAARLEDRARRGRAVAGKTGTVQHPS